MATLAALGCLYQAGALIAVRRFFATPAAPAPMAGDVLPVTLFLPVTLLKPLYGDEPRLADNLASFLAQDYAAPVQMVCGVNRPDDGAMATANMLNVAQDGAARMITLTVASHASPPHPPARNGKIGNLMAMMPAARHDILILSDSDMVVMPDYLAQVTTALARPGTGAVTCLYVGRGDAGFWSCLGAAMIDWQVMPNMVVGLVAGLARPCMGSTIAITRTTLDAIGGFARFADVLADDHAIGAAVAEQGLAVAVPPMLTIHAGTEASLAALWRHQLRWAVTVRGIAGAGHYGSLITHAVPLALISMPFHPALGLMLVGVALGLRWRITRAVAWAGRRLTGRPVPPVWLLPLADCLGFAIFLSSLVARRIDWRGATLTMAHNGWIAPSDQRDQ